MKYTLTKNGQLGLFIVFLICCQICSSTIHAQDVTAPYIKSVKLYKPGDQTSFPMINLNSSDVLELDFDDISNEYKNYYYSLVLCNADWSPGMLHSFEYINGFENTRITTYRNSSIANTRYIYYQAFIPDHNSLPNKAGNYLLKVFLDNDTSRLVFTRRMVIVDNQANIAAQVLQPFNSALYQNDQKLQLSVRTGNRIQAYSPSDIKVTVLQNNNWNTSLFLDRPTIFRGNYYEYSDDEKTSMPAGREFRWVDLRSLRLMSDRMLRMDNRGDTTKVFMKPDPPRVGMPYVYYKDLNGSYTIESIDNVNPFWQADYAYVHFTYFPPGNRAFEGKDVFIMGEMTNYGSDTSAKMVFNAERGAYEKTLFLKQGYYNYLYTTQPINGKGYPDFTETEGNYTNTENTYTILVYFRPFGARYDSVIGFAMVSSLFQKGGL
jgi:hypothetical protein